MGVTSNAASVKRILRELRELATTSNPDIAAVACEDELFEWVFAIRGAWGSEFEGGVYIGRIHMPAEYPFKPPGFTMLTPSGRFEINTKICLSISSYHPESWQPSWSVESALVALIAFMQTEGGGAIGSMDCPKEDRRAMAAESRVRPPRVGCAVKQALVDSLHAKLMGLEEESRKLVRGGASEAGVEDEGVVAEDVGEWKAMEPAGESGPDLETDSRPQQQQQQQQQEELQQQQRHPKPPAGVDDDEARASTSAARTEPPLNEERATTTDTTITTKTTTILMTSAITILVLWHLAMRVYTRRTAQSQLDAGLSYSWTSPDIIPEYIDENREL